MSKQFNLLLAHLSSSLAKSGLKLSAYGQAELLKRYSKPESAGGLSDYWHNL